MVFTRKNGILFISALMIMALVFIGCSTDSDSDPEPDPSNPYGDLSWDKIASWDGTDSTTVLGEATEAMPGTDTRYKETALGNLIADGIAAYAGYASGEPVDFAMLNGQGIQGSAIQKGNITFDNFSGNFSSDKLFLVTYTGAEVENLINEFVNSSSPGKYNSNCVVLVSKEVSYTVTPDADESQPPSATAIKVNGAPIVADKDYRVAVGNFMSGDTTNGGNQNFEKYGKDKTATYATDTLKQAVAKYILAKGTISPPELGRITGTVPVIQSQP
jgi:5'-nucleotidase